MSLRPLRTQSGQVSLIRDANRVSEKMPNTISPSILAWRGCMQCWNTTAKTWTVQNPYYDNISKICARNDVCDGSDVTCRNRAFSLRPWKLLQMPHFLLLYNEPKFQCCSLLMVNFWVFIVCFRKSSKPYLITFHSNRIEILHFPFKVHIKKYTLQKVMFLFSSTQKHSYIKMHLLERQNDLRYKEK